MYACGQWRIYKQFFSDWFNHNEIIWVFYKFINSIKNIVLYRRDFKFVVLKKILRGYAINMPLRCGQC